MGILAAFVGTGCLVIAVPSRPALSYGRKMEFGCGFWTRVLTRAGPPSPGATRGAFWTGAGRAAGVGR